MIFPNITYPTYLLEGNNLGGFPAHQFLPITLTTQFNGGQKVASNLFIPGQTNPQNVSMKSNANKDRVEYTLTIQPEEGASLPLLVDISFTQGDAPSLPVGMQAQIMAYTINDDNKGNPNLPKIELVFEAQ